MRASFGIGQLILIGGRQHEIVARLPDGNIQVKDLALNTFASYSYDDLVTMLFDTVISIPRGDPEFVKKYNKNGFLEQDLNSLPEHRKAKFDRRWEYVSQLNEFNLDRKTKKSLDPLLQFIAKNIGDRNPPSWITAYRWLSRFYASGDNARALICYDEEKGRKSQIDEEVVKIIHKSIAKIFLSKQQNTVQEVLDDVTKAIMLENHYRDSQDRLVTPNYHVIYRRIQKLDPYDIAAARFGKRYADQKFGMFGRGPRPDRALERVEIDHTRLRLFVVDDNDMLPMGRPWLTTAIDVKTKYVLGFFISFEPPSHLSTMKCALHAILPKQYVKKKYPGIENTWTAYGLMEWLVTDNGPEFISTHLEDACKELGIKLLYQKVKKPWLKPSIERYFGTLNTKLLYKQRGAAFRNFPKIDDYEPAKNAVISFSTLLECVHKWIIDSYHKSRHKGINDIPQLAWDRSIKLYPPSLPYSRRDLNVLLGMIKSRKLGPQGVELEGIFYADETLAGLRKRGRTRVKIKIDPSDLGFIHVYDEDIKRYLPIPAIDPAYACGLTLWQHKVCKRYVREKLKSEINTMALLRAKDEIQEIVKKDMARMRKSGHRQKAARFLGVGLKDHKAFLAGVEESIDKAHDSQLNPIEQLICAEFTGESFSGCSTIGRTIPIEDAIAEDAPRGHIVLPDRKKKIRNKVPEEKKQERKKISGLPIGPTESIDRAEDTGDEKKIAAEGWSADYNLPKKERGKWKKA